MTKCATYPEDNPVREPLDIIVVAGGLEGLDGEVGRKSPADELRDGLREGVDEEGDEHERGHGEEAIGLGDLCPLLELVRDRVLGQLQQ